MEKRSKPAFGFWFATAIFLAIPNGYALTWDQVDVGTNANFTSVAYGNGVYVLVGQDGNHWTSTNLTQWNHYNTGYGENFRVVKFFKGKFIAGTTGGFTTNEITKLMTSSDGASWTLRYSNTNAIESSSGGTFSRMAIHDMDEDPNGSIVAVGGVSWNGGPSTSLVVRSADGLTWSEIEVVHEDEQITGVAFGEGRFVAVKGNGTSYISDDDGVSWTSYTNGPGPASSIISYGNGQFVSASSVGGFDGRTTINSATNGYDWSTRFLPFGSPSYLLGSAYSRTYHVIAGLGDAVLVSTNGTFWTLESLPVSQWYSGMNECNGTFMIAGYGGTLIQSSGLPVDPPVLHIENAVEIFWQDESGVVYQPQYSPDGSFWSNVGSTVTGSGAVSRVPDVQPVHTTKYYRLVIP